MFGTEESFQRDTIGLVHQANRADAITIQPRLICDQSNVVALECRKAASLQNIDSIEHIDFRCRANFTIRRLDNRSTCDCSDATDEWIHKAFAVRMNAVRQKNDIQILHGVNPDSGAREPAMSECLRRHQVAAIR